jgi:glycine oxidase
MSDRKPVADVVVVGAGVIGLAIALEMQSRGARVVVVERGEAMQQASRAAAGMLAVDDPYNPAELLELARLSVHLYPAFLRRIGALSGMAVPFQTETTLQYDGAGGVTRLLERSIDPRQLAPAMVAAVQAGSIALMEWSSLVDVGEVDGELRLSTAHGVEIAAKAVVYAAGAWTTEAARRGFGSDVAIRPRKGQMLRVSLPQGLVLNEVHRSEQVYIVPRTIGPRAGTALIGATVEDVGFDVEVHAEALDRLRGLAAELVPEIEGAPVVEAWAGLRPGTPDGLPVLGAGEKPGRFVAAGHHRNGVLLAPGTAEVIADLLMGKQPAVNLSAFGPRRVWR